MSAKFLKHDRVQFTAELKKQLPKLERFGRVTSDQRDLAFVNVRPDGCKGANRYAVQFVARVKEPERAR